MLIKSIANATTGALTSKRYRNAQIYGYPNRYLLYPTKVSKIFCTCIYNGTYRQIPPYFHRSNSDFNFKIVLVIIFREFLPTPARGNANGISEIIKQKEKRGCYCARCLCTRHIKAAVSAAEREIKGDIARKKIDVV